MYGINTNPILPVRKKPQEESEMTTQLLFGELFSIDDINDNWYFICNSNDQYKGWVDKKMVTKLDENEFNFLYSNKSNQISKAFVACVVDKEPITLPAGSFIRFYDKKEELFVLINKTYSIPSSCFIETNNETLFGNLVVDIAKTFLNAPYLWGGKTSFGIDCSGLVQLCYSICDIQLPRDASQQISHGESVSFLQESEAGDLAFFENEEGKICHVGILIDSSTIIHASGRVRIDKIDNIGIKRIEDDKYTHKLRLIKRIF